MTESYWPATARGVACDALTQVASSFPKLHAMAPQPEALEALEPRDARLAMSIYRTAVSRWLTIDHLISYVSHQPLSKMQPMLQAVLAASVAQGLFMERVPVHAIVDQAVKLSKDVVRPAAGSITNAVLRSVFELIEAKQPDIPWTMETDTIPVGKGLIRFKDQIFALKAVEKQSNADFIADLSAATSQPAGLLNRLSRDKSHDELIAFCQHQMQQPPMTLVMPGVKPRIEVDGEAVDETDDKSSSHVTSEVTSLDAATSQQRDLLPVSPHESEGFWVWNGNSEQLRLVLAANPSWRVQDPTAAAAVAATADISISSLEGDGNNSPVIIDYCAGRGTKTKQAAQMYPEAIIVASDVDHDRWQSLDDSFRDMANVLVVAPAAVEETVAKQSNGRGADMLMLDVPCTNTGVLPRRIEAKYRFTRGSLDSLVKLQRQIISSSLSLLAAGGTLLYSTCSIDSGENEKQVVWMGRQGLELISQTATQPGGESRTYHDGGYFAILKKV